ncbi:MAG: GAF domain-containing protein [Chloroflexi bacterium]|nr:GAF domain-containing protein [Chloroflexota bacterium]
MERNYHDYYQALYRVAQTVNSSLDLREVLSELTRSVTEATGFKACSLRLLAPDRNRLLPAAVHGLSSAYVDKGPVLLENSPIDRLIIAGEVVQITDAASDPRWQYPEETETEGICSVLSVPLRAKARIIGVLRTYTATPHLFDQEETQLLLALANLGALAIENARCYEETRSDYHRTLDALMGFPVAAGAM